MRTISGLALVLALFAGGVWAAEIQPQVPDSGPICSSPKASQQALPAKPPDLGRLVERPHYVDTVTDDCLPADQTCWFYAFGDCLYCDGGTYICSNWMCSSGALYTCCSECMRFAC